ncbi:hypothetical protein OG223_45830 [Streptomyces sp. NBC_01478]|uniref:hypothetical protein n=1 Tax=Streptomyces sp. NBC_01478 TaxID=2903882 RepID=UPI002E304D52|nr:hypothetical protein [Streptomyces sp. NBC_01478]
MPSNSPGSAPGPPRGGDKQQPSSSRAWVPARRFPESYPGDCPTGHYLYFDGSVLPVMESGSDEGYEVTHGGRTVPIDRFLADAGLPPLSERFPVLAYGANRNPATLEVKLLNYGYGAHANQAIPVLSARLTDADVVACGLHGQGYMYGELLMGSPFSKGVEINVRVLFVDEDGLRVLNESEGVSEGMYSVARIPGVRVSGAMGEISVLGYVANARVWTSPHSNSPIAYSTINATGRRVPAMTPRQIMEHALDVLDLRDLVCRLSGLDRDGALAGELAKYLNGQWWYAFNTGDAPIQGYSRILEQFRTSMANSALPSRTYDYLEQLGCLLPPGTEYQRRE